MKKIIAAITFLFIFCLLPAAGAEQFVPTDPVLPLSQVKAGMKARVRTVLEGTQISEFDATLLGVVPRKTSPKNLILIRIDDQYVRGNGGIAAGMSGSPVYVDGKLVGAIGYGWSFSDRNLGLVTPIEEMVKAMDWPDRIPAFGVSPKIPSEPAGGRKGEPIRSDDLFASLDVFQEATADEEEDEDVQSDDIFMDVSESEDEVPISDDIDLIEFLKTAELEPLAMPLLVDGISTRVTERMQKRLGVDLIPLGSSAGSGTANLNKTLKPGSAMGAALAWGDITMGGIGTLTAVSKDGRFLAFAHPMMNYGAVAYPLTEASIIKIIPSISSSFKLGYQGPIVGIITQDRPEAIGGYFGRLAPATSYAVKFHNLDKGEKATKRFQTAVDAFTAPYIGTMGMLGIIDDLWARRGEGTAVLKYKFSGGNLVEGWERRNMFFSGEDLIGEMTMEFDALSRIFALNQFQEIRPFGVELEVEITREPKVVFIEKVEIADKKEFYAPGEIVPVDVTLRPWRKHATVKHLEVTVPESAFGFCEIVVRGGGIAEQTQDSLIAGYRAITNLEDLINELNAEESNNQLIVEIVGPEDFMRNMAEKESDMMMPSPEDFLDDRMKSEIIQEQLDENSLLIVETNYYVEGLLRKFIRIKREDGKGADMTEAEMEALASQHEKNEEAEAQDEESDEQVDLFFRKSGVPRRK